MNSRSRATAVVLGVYAGLLGAVHGVFEMHQGGTPGGVMINAIGAPCQADGMWHACLPAMTLVPDFVTTGVLAVAVSLAALVWAAAFVQRRRGGLILMLLSVSMLLVGGGFVPMFTGIIAGVAGTRIDAPLTPWRTRLLGRARGFLAGLWLWALSAFVIWSLGAWIVGYFSNRAMMSLGMLPFFLFDLGLPIVTVVAATAGDAHAPAGAASDPRSISHI